MKTLLKVAVAYAFAFLAVVGLDFGLDGFTAAYATTLLAFLMLPVVELAFV